MNYKEIAEKLRKAFEDSPYSYGELSKVTGIPKSALQRYITGDTSKIPMDRLRLICDRLGLDAAELLGWDESEKTPESEASPTIIKVQHPETRILAHGFDQLPEADRIKALEMMNLIFGPHFMKGKEEDDEA